MLNIKHPLDAVLGNAQSRRAEPLVRFVSILRKVNNDFAALEPDLGRLERAARIPFCIILQTTRRLRHSDFPKFKCKCVKGSVCGTFGRLLVVKPTGEVAHSGSYLQFL